MSEKVIARWPGYRVVETTTGRRLDEAAGFDGDGQRWREVEGYRATLVLDLLAVGRDARRPAPPLRRAAGWCLMGYRGKKSRRTSKSPMRPPKGGTAARSIASTKMPTTPRSPPPSDHHYADLLELVERAQPKSKPPRVGPSGLTLTAANYGEAARNLREYHGGAPYRCAYCDSLHQTERCPNCGAWADYVPESLRARTVITRPPPPPPPHPPELLFADLDEPPRRNPHLHALPLYLLAAVLLGLILLEAL